MTSKSRMRLPRVGADDRWMTTKEVAKYLNCHPNTLEQMRSRGDGIPSHKLGNKAVRYLKSEVDAYMLGGGHE